MKNNIAAIRKIKNESQESLAKKAEISRTHLSDIENDNADPTGPIMFRIAKALGVSLDTIFFDDNVNHKQQELNSNVLKGA